MVIGVIVVYLIVVVGIGIYVSRYAKTPADFLIGGHNIGLIAAVGTYLGTFFSALSLLGGVGGIYTSGISGSWLPMSWAVGSAIGPIIAWRFRKMKFISPTQFMAHRYGSTHLQAFSGFMIVIALTIFLIIQLTAMGVVWNLATGRTFVEGVIIGVILAVVYTAFGGFLAVVWTDVLQAAVFSVVIFVGAALVLANTGGIVNLYSAAAAINTAPVLGGNETAAGSLVSVLGPFTPLALFFIFLIQGPGTGSHPQYLMRMQAAKSMKVALNAYKYSWILLLFIYISLNIVGVGGRVLVPTMPEGMAADWIFPYLFTLLAHPILQGLFFAALLAAAMSTIDSQFMVISSATSIDIVKNWWTSVTEKQLLVLSRVVVIVVGIIAALITIGEIPLLINVAGYTFGIIGLAFFWPTLLGLYWKKANLNGAWACIIGGIVGFVFWQVTYGSSIAGIPPLGIGIAVGGLLMWGVSLFTSASDKEQWSIYFEDSEKTA
jgi:SSS family transporter